MGAPRSRLVPAVPLLRGSPPSCDFAVGVACVLAPSRGRRCAEQGAAGICAGYVASRPREGNSVFSAFFPPFCWGMSAYRRTVRGIASRARQSCCQYEQDTIVGTQWQALASVHTRYSSKLLYSGTWLAAADGLIMAPPATVLRICV